MPYFLPGTSAFPSDESSARLMASSVEGHPLLVEKIVAQAGRGDLGGLLEDVKKHRGDLVPQISTVYDGAMSALMMQERLPGQPFALISRRDSSGGAFKAAAGKSGLMALREAALADFIRRNRSGSGMPRWPSTPAVTGPYPQRSVTSRLMALAPAWTGWLDRLPVGRRAYQGLRMFVSTWRRWWGHVPRQP